MDFPMRINAFIPLIFAALAFNAQAVEFEYLGLYSDIRQSSQSQDCGGFDIELWAIRGKSARSNITGLLRLVDGNCDKSPRPIFNGHLDLRTGELTFDVPVAEAPVLSVGAFKGALKDGSLMGTLTLTNGEPLQGNTQEMSVKVNRKQDR